MQVSTRKERSTENKLKKWKSNGVIVSSSRNEGQLWGVGGLMKPKRSTTEGLVLSPPLEPGSPGAQKKNARRSGLKIVPQDAMLYQFLFKDKEVRVT